MERVRDEFTKILEVFVPLGGKRVLEVGCGSGEHSVKIASRCAQLVGIDPDPKQLQVANNRAIVNASFHCERMQQTTLNEKFDVIIFALSLHHVAPSSMRRAINQAVRLTQPDGYIAFLEPGTEGSFFETEIKFGACDGDERKAKEAAYLAMQKHPALILVEEINDYVILRFDDTPDFIASMKPVKDLHILESFLCRHNHFLKASVRINIYKLRS
jgi:2-polyprenyl-3-methyl-5-hydroxy-6-metoxy-1,4-benzoquinol methylase